MPVKKRTPEENARRSKIRELLDMSNITSMDDIQNLFKETIAEFMEDGLETELDEELGSAGTIIATKTPKTAVMATAVRHFAPVSVM